MDNVVGSAKLYDDIFFRMKPNSKSSIKRAYHAVRMQIQIRQRSAETKRNQLTVVESGN